MFRISILDLSVNGGDKGPAWRGGAVELFFREEVLRMIERVFQHMLIPMELLFTKPDGDFFLSFIHGTRSVDEVTQRTVLRVG